MTSVFGLFSLQGVAGFVLGAAGMRLYIWWRDHHAGLRSRSKSLVLAWVLMVLVIGYIGAQAQVTHDATVTQTRQAAAFAASTKHCQDELIAALRTRTTITTDNDYWANQQRLALRDLISALIAPPAEIAVLAGDDPARMTYTQTVLAKASARIDDAQAQLDQNAADRAAHPYPDPDCT